MRGGGGAAAPPTKLAIFAGFEGDHALATFATFVNVTVPEKEPKILYFCAKIVTVLKLHLACQNGNCKVV